MSAPERIWAGPSPVYRREEKWSWNHGDWDCDGETISYGELATEYLRADLAAAQVAELVEAENARLREDVSEAAAILLKGGMHKIAPEVLNAVLFERAKWEGNPAMKSGEVPPETVTLSMFEACLRAIAALQKDTDHETDA